MAFQLNQFKLTKNAGEVMNANPNTISARITSDEASYYVAGAVLKYDTAEAGDAPVMEEITLGQGGEGVLLFNAQKAKRYADEMVEVALLGSIVTMIAATAIARGASVAYAPATGYVSTTTGAKIGKALDIASTTGDIIRVLVNPSES